MSEVVISEQEKDLQIVAGIDLISSEVDSSLDQLQYGVNQIVQAVLSDPTMSEAFFKYADGVWEDELYLAWPDRKERVAFNMIPLVTSSEKTEAAKHLVTNLTRAKVGAVGAIAKDPKLRAFMEKGLPEITIEIMRAALADPNAVQQMLTNYRLRFDTFSPSSGGKMQQLELNGGEPQADILCTATYKLLRKMLEIYMRENNVPAEDMRAILCHIELPIDQVATRLAQIYRKNRIAYGGQLPEQCNVGIFAFRDPDTGKNRNILSNTEAAQSVPYFEANQTVDKAQAFCLFDITGFREVHHESGAIHLLPILKDGTEVHMIRRLHGEPMENIDLWHKLRDARPEIYYKVIGLQHKIHNPDGHAIPTWMWMNPLNSWLTDKKLDALLSDPVMDERFGIRRQVKEVLAENGLTDDDAEEAMAAVEGYMPETLLVTTDRIEELSNRPEWVIKLGTLMGHSGEGVFVGTHMPVDELPEQMLVAALEALSQVGIDFSEYASFAEIAGSFDNGHAEQEEKIRDILWQQLVVYCATTGDAIAQRRAESQYTEAVMCHSKGSGDFRVESHEGIRYDFNPQTFGDEGVHVILRVTQAEHRTNVTGGVGGVGAIIQEDLAKIVIESTKFI